LPVPAPEKVELAKAPEPSPDARHLDGKKLERLLETIDTATDDGLRARALLELLVASGCRISEVIGLERAKLELDRHAPTPPDGNRIVDEVTVFGKGSRYRRVFLTRRAREWLQMYLRARTDKDPALFVTRRKKPGGPYPMGVKMAQTILARAASPSSVGATATSLPSSTASARRRCGPASPALAPSCKSSSSSRSPSPPRARPTAGSRGSSDRRPRRECWSSTTWGCGRSASA